MNLKKETLICGEKNNAIAVSSSNVDWESWIILIEQEESGNCSLAKRQPA